jgi:hypothetical protein
MRINTRHAGWALCLALGLAAAGCAKGTYLEVEFTGSAQAEIHAIRVDLALTPPNGATQQSSDTIKTGSVIKLPTSMAFKLDTETGSLKVDATLLGLGNEKLGSASKNTTIMRGETWTVVLNFSGQ